MCALFTQTSKYALTIRKYSIVKNATNLVLVFLLRNSAPMQVVSLVLHVKSIWVTLIMFRSSWLHVKTHNEVMRCVCLQPEHLEFEVLHEGTIFLQIDTAHPRIVATQKQAVKKIVPI